MLLQYDFLSSDVTNAMWVDENNVYNNSYWYGKDAFSCMLWHHI